MDHTALGHKCLYCASLGDVETMLRQRAEDAPEREADRCEEEGDAILARLPEPPEDSRWGVTNLGGGWTITLTSHKRFHGETAQLALFAAALAIPEQGTDTPSTTGEED